ncbi:hypothetical protein J601_3797 [Acinetobacter baumannii 831240]|uniref:hypothetical protein n=1 Tax=Acinetobacter baumannii TaxID=470 RepID=UPI00044892B5|nr:hypothetical protein J601_3797 [Acinetobacter baumannii 831240]
MDKCREEFEKWFEETHDVIITTQFKKEGERYLDRNVRRSFETWQHQQAKVGELQKQLNEYIFVAETLDEMYVKEVKSSDELQKRVDAALKLMQKPVIVGEPAKYVCARFKEIEQALKGECRHESDGTNRLSLPPKTKCKKCGKFYSANVLKGEG